MEKSARLMSEEDRKNAEVRQLIKKGIAEAIGISGLTFLACGVGSYIPELGTIAVAFGAVIVAMAYTVGNISGCHINPAISLNMLIRKKMTVTEFFVYIFEFFHGIKNLHKNFLNIIDIAFIAYYKLLELHREVNNHIK